MTTPLMAPILVMAVTEVIASAGVLQERGMIEDSVASAAQEVWVAEGGCWCRWCRRWGCWNCWWSARRMRHTSGDTRSTHRYEKSTSSTRSQVTTRNHKERKCQGCLSYCSLKHVLRSTENLIETVLMSEPTYDLHLFSTMRTVTGAARVPHPRA